jgi:hypothetical protein
MCLHYQETFVYSYGQAPYALAVKYFLRVVCCQVLESNKGADLCSDAGVAKFLRLVAGSEPSAAEQLPIKSMLEFVKKGHYDEQVFEWSELGETEMVNKGGAGIAYLTANIAPLMGTLAYPLLSSNFPAFVL